MAARAASNLWRVRLWAYAPLVIWIGVIFFFSSSQGSMSQTSLFIGPLLQFLFPEMPDETRLAVHGLVRKAAHITEYAVLAMLAVRTIGLTTNIGTWPTWLISLTIVASVAALDEFNQSFLPQRTGSTYDVLIDIAGGILGILLAALISQWSTRRSMDRRQTPSAAHR